jgi:hypothetical protein
MQKGKWRKLIESGGNRALERKVVRTRGDRVLGSF